MNEQLHDPTAFEYRSSAALRLAELLAIAGDLSECSSILNRLAGEGDRDALWLAALVLYRRASAGATRPGFSREQVASLGSSALGLHERMLGEAQSGCSQSRMAYAETKIAAVVEGNKITTITAVPLRARQLEDQIVKDCRSMVEALLHEIIAPQVASLEKSLLEEVQILGVQLVRCLPRVGPKISIGV